MGIDEELEEATTTIDRWAVGFENDDIVRAYRRLLAIVDELRAEVANAREGHVYYRSKTAEFMGANLELSNAVARLTAERDMLRGAIRQWYNDWNWPPRRGPDRQLYQAFAKHLAAPKPTEPEEGGDD